MKNDRDKLVKLLLQSDPIKERNLDDDWGDGELEEVADHLIANNIIVPPCKIGETLYLIQIDYKGNYSLNSCEVASKITMFSILRAYEEKTVVYMTTDKNEAEEKFKELKEKISDGK